MEPLNVEHRGRTLRGVLHLPQRPAPVPAVVLCHGFGGTRSEFGYTFVHLAKRLTEHGIAAYRFDFAGCGESDGDFAELTVSDQVDQVVTVLDQLSRHRAVDPERLSLLGMSMGGLAASLAAAKRSVRSLALWAPAAIAIAAEDVAEDARWSEIVEHGYQDFGGLPVYARFVEDGVGIDPWADAAAHAGPVLFAWGTNDEVSPAEVVDRYRAVYGDRFEEHRFKGVGHGFETVADRERLLESTAAFIRRVA